MTTELRQIHSQVLHSLMENDENIVVLEADLMGSVSTKSIAEQLPQQFIQCGIAESNMIGVAAGLAATGKIPFVHSFGCFITRRCYDQLFLSGGYAKQHINIFGSDAGVAAVTNGGTHMPLEDIGLMRLIPNARVIDVSDRYVLEAAIQFAYQNKGINYIRSSRKALPDLYSDASEITIGKGNVIKEGNDVTLVATGLSVNDAKEAANELESKGVSVAVLDLHTIKPLDIDLIASYAQKTQHIVTIENHNCVGGLGETVATHLLTKGVAIKHFSQLGVKEQFGQVGDLDYLKQYYGIDKGAIVDHILTVVAK